MREENVLDYQQHGNENHGRKLGLVQHGQRSHKRAVQLRPNLAAIVPSHQYHFPTARGRSIKGIAGLVLGNHVLAHTACEEFGENGLPERLAREQDGGEQRDDNGRNRQHRQEKGDHSEKSRGKTAYGARSLGTGRTGEILDGGRQTRFLLQMVGYVQRRLLLLFCPCGARPYLLGQMRNMFHYFRHMLAFHLPKF